MLRIAGAIQVLEELLGHEEIARPNGELESEDALAEGVGAALDEKAS